MRFLIALLLVALLAMNVFASNSSSDELQSDSQSDEANIADSGRLSAERARQIAQQHVKDYDFVDENWKNAQVSEQAREFHRPDITEGPAYYEFQVLTSAGAPAGFVIVSAGEHDHPVVHFQTKGQRLSEVLDNEAQEQGHKVHRLFKLDSTSYVAENEEEVPVSHAVRDMDIIAKWKDLKNEYPTRFAEHLQQLRVEAQPSWKPSASLQDSDDSLAEENPDEDSSDINTENLRDSDMWGRRRARRGSDTTKKTPSHTKGKMYTSVPSVGLDSPSYTQLKDSKGCASGCGPTAWAMVIFVEDHNPKWTKFKGSFLKNGKKLSSSHDASVNSLMWELNRTMDTKCWFNSKQAATLPWKMDNLDKFFSKRGFKVKAHTKYSLVRNTGWPFRMRNATRDKIKQGHPVIVGTGFFSHYPMARAVCWKVNPWYKADDYYYYLNQGWANASKNGWIKGGIWFAGWLA